MKSFMTNRILLITSILLLLKGVCFAAEQPDSNRIITNDILEQNAPAWLDSLLHLEMDTLALEIDSLLMKHPRDSLNLALPDTLPEVAPVDTLAIPLEPTSPAIRLIDQLGVVSRDSLQQLIQSGADLNAPDSSGVTPLLWAVQHDDLDLLAWLVDHQVDLTEPDDPHDSPFYLAEKKALTGNETAKQMVYRLRRAAPEPNQPLFDVAWYGYPGLISDQAQADFDDPFDKGFFKGNTPLMVAAYRGDQEVVQALIEQPQDLDRENPEGQTALMIAEAQGHTQIVEILRDAGARDYLYPADRALFEAAARGDVTQIETVLYSGGDLYATTVRGQNPLTAAVQAGRLQAARFLIQQGADYTLRDIHERTMLMLAAEQGNPDLIDLFYQRGLDPYDQDIDGKTALMIAAENGHVEAFQLLVKKGSDLYAKDVAGETAFFKAAKAGHLEIVDFYVKHGVDLNEPAQDGTTPLMAAAGAGHLQVVEHLLDNGAGVYLHDNEGKTPLMLAAKGGHYRVAERLIAAHASVLLADFHGRTAIMFAFANGNTRLIELLIRAGATINDRDAHGKTTLMYLAESGNMMFANALIRAGANTTDQDDHGTTALMIAARQGHVEFAEFLLNHGANVNRRREVTFYDEQGRRQVKGDRATALQWAVMARQPAMVQLLVDAGAILDSRNPYDETPLYRATAEGYEEITHILRQAGAY
ncbi:MAG: ankyrin repeat domain-containing protein [Gemmatimonadetes bacterium]|nr:MAG: ankyrin repeat domain-containing protein [Gemmatimonadota bacterium]